MKPIGEKTMSDKELIETLNKIHLHCYRTQCDECKFYLLNNKNYCQIAWLTGLLANTPYKWDIKKIKEVICK